MSLTARKEMLTSLRQKYQVSNWTNKGKILDVFFVPTGYERKYAETISSIFDANQHEEFRKLKRQHFAVESSWRYMAWINVLTTVLTNSSAMFHWVPLHAIFKSLERVCVKENAKGQSEKKLSEARVNFLIC